VRRVGSENREKWTPAFAGMTVHKEHGQDGRGTIGIIMVYDLR
jgi:hypothetical protein